MATVGCLVYKPDSRPGIAGVESVAFLPLSGKKFSTQQQQLRLIARAKLADIQTRAKLKWARLFIGKLTVTDVEVPSSRPLLGSSLADIFDIEKELRIKLSAEN